MTDDLPDRAVRSFQRYEAVERDGDWFVVTTTAFDARVTAEPTDEGALRYTVEVRAPTLQAATADAVGDSVAAGWFETYDRRLEDAAMAVRHDVELTERRVFEEAGDAVAVFAFEWGDADEAPGIAKALSEYVEGTYVEGIVPGYEYEPPVSELLSAARRSGGDDAGGGPMPL
jgi:hypothetical protein